MEKAYPSIVLPSSDARGADGSCREDSVPTLEQAEKDFLVKLQKCVKGVEGDVLRWCRHNLRVRRKDATREMEVDYIELAERRLAPNPKPQVVLSASDEEKDEVCIIFL